MIMLCLWGVIFLLLVFVVCVSFLLQVDCVLIYVFIDMDDMWFGVVFWQQVGMYFGQDVFYLLIDLVDVLDVCVLFVDCVDCLLDFQYYIWYDDLIGYELVDVVICVVDCGVCVCVLFDDFGINVDDCKLFEISVYLNIEIWLFNLVVMCWFKKFGMVFEFLCVNWCMYNKVMIVDNQVVIVGGCNIGDEYFGVLLMLEFGDFDVVVYGLVVKDILIEFDMFWNLLYVYLVDMLVGYDVVLGGFDCECEWLCDYLWVMEDNLYVLEVWQWFDWIVYGQGMVLLWGYVMVLYDDLLKIVYVLKDSDGYLMLQLCVFVLQLQYDLLIVLLYFVLGKDVVEWLCVLMVCGVCVMVLINLFVLIDVVVVYVGYWCY